MNVEKIIIRFLKNNGFSTEEIDDLIKGLSEENHIKETEQKNCIHANEKQDHDLAEKGNAKIVKNKTCSNTDSDLYPGYMYAEDAAKYLLTTTRKLSLYRRQGLLKYSKYGKSYVYKKEWLDQFAEEWNGYDMSNTEKISMSINTKAWKKKHKM